jgi:decaprenyl-phosphate phosphoribosyltransferase
MMKFSIRNYKMNFRILTKGLVKITRPTHWIKNIFVLAPLLFSGGFMHWKHIEAALFAMLLFCVGSSATYIVNDIKDIENDRCHPVKSKKRPLATGEVSVFAAKILLFIIYLTLACGWFINSNVVMVIITYLLLNFAYTFILKNQPVIDIFTIASGFVLRVYAGAVALSVPVSSWMFVTTLCLALYLAAIKRRQELIQSGTEGRKVLKNYSVSLMDRYAEMSATSALLFYSMFVMSTRPELIITIPLVLYGMFRYWYIVEVIELGESPTDALLDDWQLLFTVILWGIACVFTI